MNVGSNDRIARVMAELAKPRAAEDLVALPHEASWHRLLCSYSLNIEVLVESFMVVESVKMYVSQQDTLVLHHHSVRCRGQ